MPQHVVPQVETGADVLHHAVGVRGPNVAVETREPLVQGRADGRLPILVRLADFRLHVNDGAGEVDVERGGESADGIHEI